MFKKKSKNQVHFREYEYMSINRHQETTGQITYHWNHVPERVLKESGFIPSFTDLRLKRKLFYERDGIHYNLMREYGLDGISVKDGVHHGLQCKLWEKKLDISDLGTFLDVMENRFHLINRESKGYLYHAGLLTKRLKDEIKNEKKWIQDVHYQVDFEEEEKIQKEQDAILEKDYVIRDYQREAIEELNREWDGVKLLSMPCGTGKTIVFCNHCRDQRYRNIWIVSPLQMHARQNLERMASFLPEYESMLIDCEDDGTRDFDEIVEKMESNISSVGTDLENSPKVNSVIFSSTFHSFKDVVSNLFDMEEVDEEAENYEALYDLSDTLLIVDEAHNLIHQEDMIRLMKSFPKVLLVTATPPCEMEEKTGCQLIYHYSFGKAIEDKSICDYEIYLPLVKINDETEESKIDMRVPDELKDLNEEMVCKALFLINGMLQTGSRRCILYMSSVDECEEFGRVIEETMQKFHYVKYWIGDITNGVYEKKRRMILQDFQREEEEDVMRFLLSVRILDEGIDIPKCDSIFVSKVGEYSSDIRMVQRMCRANRQWKGNKNKRANCFIWSDEKKSLLNTLQLLKETDVEFRGKIRYIRDEYDGIEMNEERVESMRLEETKLQEWISVKCVSYREMWEMKRMELFRFVEENGKVPMRRYEGEYFAMFSWMHYNIKFSKRDSWKIVKLSENEIVRNYMIGYWKRLEEKINRNIYSENEKIRILNEYFDEKYKLTGYRSDIELFKKDDELPITVKNWFSSNKVHMRNEDSQFYQKLSEYPLIKIHLDMYLKKRSERPDRKPLKINDSLELCIAYIEQFGDVPDTKTGNFNGYPVYNHYTKLRVKIKDTNSDLYKRMCVNEKIRDKLDSYLKIRNESDKDKLTYKQFKVLLMKYVESNGKCPTGIHSIDGVIIGKYFDGLKGQLKDQTDPKYIELSSMNESIKKALDTFFEKREYNKNRDKLTFDDFLPLLFEFAEKNHRHPYPREEYKGQPLGKRFIYFKEFLKDKNDERYIKMSQNQDVKKTLDFFFENRDVKKTEVKLSYEQKLKILIDECTKRGKVVSNKDEIEHPEYGNVKVGSFMCYHLNYMKDKDNKVYRDFSVLPCLKERMDDYLDKKGVQ